MLRAAVRSLAVWFLSACFILGLADWTCAQTVWSGLTVSFAKPGFANPQTTFDAISPSVALTRGDVEGLFNIVEESQYDRLGHTSPAGTRWATTFTSENQTIAASNWEALTFSTWFEAYGSAVGATIVGLPAVLHLVAEDVYLDIQFTSWGVGFPGGGSFSYDRATGTLPPPPTTTGDYNLNGIVDAADYTVWRDTLGQTADPPGSGADGDQSGIIDIGDYDFWKARFGDVVPLDATAAAVPEPCTLGLLLAVLLTIGTFRRSPASPRR